MSEEPTKSDLAAVAAFTERFEASGFSPGEWVKARKREDGVIVMGWWSASPEVAEWHHALYDHNIIDPDCDYLSESTRELVERLLDDPSLIAELDLPTVRRVLTCISRTDRFVEGSLAGAFESGIAQAATRRLGKIAE